MKRPGSSNKGPPPPRLPNDEEILDLERLVRLAARAFFDPIDIVILDNLIRLRSKVKDEALAQLLNLPTKEVKASLNFLKANYVVTSETRNEKDQIVTSQEENYYEPGQKKTRTKSINHNLWFIDYPKFMDMLRFRLWKLSTNTHQDEKVFYKCTNTSCQQIYDAIKGPQYAFKCRDKCDSPLEKVIQTSGQGANLGALTSLMDQLKKCDDLPFPQFEKWITEVEDDYEQTKAKPRPRMGVKFGREIDVKIEVDLNELQHPATMSILPLVKDETVSRGPPPWMTKPINAIAANSGQLIIKTPVRMEKKTDKQEVLFDLTVPHWPSDPHYKRFWELQSCYLKKDHHTNVKCE
jgi:transcription initiation factor IIE alpha subunit